MNLGEYIAYLRRQRGLSQRMLAQTSGISNATISRIEAGGVNPDTKTLSSLAAALQVDAAYLFEAAGNGEQDELPAKTLRIPVLGKVTAGVPVEAIEEILGYEELNNDDAKGGQYFGLQISGDSMEPRMLAGDVVIVRRQDDVESGKIAVVLVENESATVKKLVKHENGISLIPFNQRYTPIFYTNEDIASLPVSIIGQVVELRSRF